MNKNVQTKKKNGFTLIELLAVIIILGVLMLIAIPSVTEYISTSRQKAFLSSASNLLDNAKRYVVANSLTEGKKFTISNGSFSGDGFDVRGKLPNSGTISVNEQMQTAIALTDGSWCAKKTYSDSEIIVTRDNGNCSIEIIETAEDSCFAFNSGTGMIMEYHENEGNNSNNPACPNDVVIPSQINGVDVTSIGPGAFITVEKYGQYCYTYDEETDEWGPDIDVGLNYIHTSSDGYYECYVDQDWGNPGRLTSVVIPNSITYIGVSAFSYNQLTTVTIPNSVTTIGDGSFAANLLTDLTIPDSVTNIGAASFGDNQLANVSIGNGVITIGWGAFRFNQLTSATIPNSVTTIHDAAFQYNYLTNVNIGNSVTKIGTVAFDCNDLTSVTIPNSVTTIRERAFTRNQMTDITIANSVTEIGAGAFNGNQLPDNQAFIYKRNSDGTEDITTVVSYGGARKENVIIPNNVTTVGAIAFTENQITSITIPSSVTFIGDWAFSWNYLVSVTIPNSVTTIGEYVFYKNQLNSVVIPNSVTTIGSSAFQTNQLTNVIIPNSVTNIGWGVFLQNQLTSVTMPAGVTIDADSISNTFYTSYVTNNLRTAGTYTAATQNGTWTKQ